jgi:hypothetical protein
VSDGGRERALAALREVRSLAADRAGRELASEVASLAQVQSDRRAVEEALNALREEQGRVEASWRARIGEVGPAHRLQSAVQRAARIRALRSRAEAWSAEQEVRAAAAHAAVAHARSALARIDGERRAVDELLARLRLERARRLERAAEVEATEVGPARAARLSRASS